jgi:hypothetical protein
MRQSPIENASLVDPATRTVQKINSLLRGRADGGQGQRQPALKIGRPSITPNTIPEDTLPSKAPAMVLKVIKLIHRAALRLTSVGTGQEDLGPMLFTSFIKHSSIGMQSRAKTIQKKITASASTRRIRGRI